MSTHVLMKVFESAPNRYEWGIRLLTLGQVDRAYDRLARYVQAGQRVLDVGCGTGALTVRAAQRGATVRGIDVSASMLDQSRQNVERGGYGERVELAEMGVAELDREPEQGYQVVMSGLVFSELTAGERAFCLAQAYRLLEPGGLLLMADEVVPQGLLRRALYTIVRGPLVFLTYVLTQTTTHALHDLPQQVEQAGFVIQSYHLNRLHSFAELVARRPTDDIVRSNDSSRMVTLNNTTKVVTTNGVY
jgi:demethylmenaquinone methyltransferase/2-methoxy-6-polyprenyl-1,4-benzoquinol methylase